MRYRDRLRAARIFAKLTQSELARAVGIDPSSISALERGRSASSAHTAQIAMVCGVSEIWLEHGEGQMLTLENHRSRVGEGDGHFTR